MFCVYVSVRDAGGNTTAIHFDHSPSTNGIFADAQGKVAALRLCYMFQHDGQWGE
jgi:hypothetical protein